MRSHLLVPLVAPAHPEHGRFLPLYAESAAPLSTDCFRALPGACWQTAVDCASRAMAGRPGAPVYSAIADFTLGNTDGAALGLLLLASLRPADTPYRRFIAGGTLEFSDEADAIIHIGATGHTAEKLKLIQTLGYQDEPTLLLLPRTGLPTLSVTDYETFNQLNMALHPVATLAEAYRACRGLAA